MTILPRIALAVLAAALLAAALPAQLVQLKSGHTLIGKIDDPSEDGLTLRRLDDGGVLELRWDQLSPECAGKLKAQFNLSVDDVSEVIVRAMAIRYEVAGAMDRIVGRVVDETPDVLMVRRHGVNYPVRRSAIKELKPVEVPVTDVYLPADFYAEKLNELAPGDDADQHIALADLLVRARDYTNAERHLEQARELGGGKQSNTLEGKLKHLALLKEAVREREQLDLIRTLLARRHFDKGLEAIEEFEQRFGEGKLAADFARLKQRFQTSRDSFLVGRVVQLWTKTAFALASSKATDPTLSYDAARTYAEAQMGQDIRQRVQRVLEIDIDEIDQLWQKRVSQRGRGTGERFHFGVGSWTLGQDAILKGTQQAKSEAKQQKSEADKAMERQTRRIQRAQERAQRAVQNRGGAGGEEDTPEAWWKSASTEEKKVFLRAYYAEFSGDFEVTSAFLDECVQCAGLGHTLEYGQSGEAKKVPCPTCHGTRFKRWIRAR